MRQTTGGLEQTLVILLAHDPWIPSLPNSIFELQRYVHVNYTV